MEIIYKIVFYGSYLSFLFLGYFFYKIIKYKFKHSIKYILYIFITLIFIYSRFIEPKIIKIQYNYINTTIKAKIVVLSDLHLGLFKDESYLEKIVQKVNNIKEIDFIVIAGDSIFYAENKNLDTLFKPLEQIKKPVFITLGSHDLELNDIKKIDLIKVFKKYNLLLLDNDSYNIDNLNIKLLGIGDNQINDDKIELINNFKKDDNLFVIAHNPDTVLRYKKNDTPILTISGHTHGGQIRLPFVYKYVIPCKGKFDQGFYNYNGNKVYISSGLGEVLLPMRLFISPVIDVLEL